MQIIVDPRKTFKREMEAAGRQVYFATSRALNLTALDFQAEERRHIRRTFTLRRASFIEKQGVKIKGGFATKRRLHVTIGVDDKASFLTKFEDQTAKRASSGHHVAIPQNVRRNKRDIVTRGNRPSALRGKPKVFKVGDKRGPRTAHLEPGLYQRMGGKRNPTVRLLYLLRGQVRIRPVLYYKRNALSTVQQRFDKHFPRELANALRTAR